MIEKNKCTLLGTLLKPHGIKGSFLLKLAGLNADDIKRKGPLFVEIDGLLVPFFMEDFQTKTSESAMLTLEGINTESRAKEFAGHLVYIGRDQIARSRTKTPVERSIQGYKVMDSNRGFIGEASGIIDIANNPLMAVKNQEREYLIPVHKDIVLEIDDYNRVIHIHAPDGLFEI